jgi:hypothetical protein
MSFSTQLTPCGSISGSSSAAILLTKEIASSSKTAQAVMPFFVELSEKGVECEASAVDGLSPYFFWKEQQEVFDKPKALTDDELKSDIFDDFKRLPTPTTFTKVAVYWSEPSLKFIPIPKIEGLLHLGAYYNHKYNLAIFITGSLESTLRAIEGLDLADKKGPWGVIMTSGEDELQLHVTPLICLQLESGVTQIIELDSVRQPLEYFPKALKQLDERKIPYHLASVSQGRQADGYSCRTDALVVVNNALRDLQEKKIADLFAYLHAKPLDDSSSRFELPISWSKTVQLTSVLSGDTKESVVSKNKDSFELFFKKNSQSVYKKTSYICETLVGAGECVIVEKSLEEEKIVSQYLLNKGYRLASKLLELEKCSDFVFKMHLDFLRQTF